MSLTPHLSEDPTVCTLKIYLDRGTAYCPHSYHPCPSHAPLSPEWLWQSLCWSPRLCPDLVPAYSQFKARGTLLTGWADHYSSAQNPQKALILQQKLKSFQWCASPHALARFLSHSSHRASLLSSNWTPQDLWTHCPPDWNLFSPHRYNLVPHSLQPLLSYHFPW